MFPMQYINAIIFGTNILFYWLSNLQIMIFTIINYIFTEQKKPDWIFKTSFIDVYHQLRKLEEIPSFVKATACALLTTLALSPTFFR